MILIKGGVRPDLSAPHRAEIEGDQVVATPGQAWEIATGAPAFA